MAVRIGEQLPPRTHIAPPLSLWLNKDGIGLLLAEPLNYTVVFLGEHRTGGIHQPASGFQDSPHRVQ